MACTGAGSQAVDLLSPAKNTKKSKYQGFFKVYGKGIGQYQVRGCPFTDPFDKEAVESASSCDQNVR